MLKFLIYIKAFIANIRQELVIPNSDKINQWALVSAKFQPIYARNRRLAILKIRIVMMASLFSILSLLWGIIDYIVFPSQIFNEVFTSRLIVSLLFLLVAIYSINFQKEFPLIACLALNILLLTSYYFFCEPIITLEPSFYTEIVLTSYSLMPFVIISVLGLFPLTVVELAFIILPLLTIFIVSSTAEIFFHSDALNLGTVWVMLVLSLIASLSSLSQLGLLIKQILHSALDSVTGCLSRKHGEETLNLTWSLSNRNKRHYCIAFVDLDHFKEVNDIFGHEQGDKILLGVALNIKRNIRASDVVIRWGGDEFLIALPDTDLNGANIVISRLFKMGFGKKPDGSIQTASIGLAERIIDNSSDLQSLIHTADERLYAVKKAGRNQYKAHSD